MDSLILDNQDLSIIRCSLRVRVENLKKCRMTVEIRREIERSEYMVSQLLNFDAVEVRRIP
jgi:hypothetical protein